MRRPPPVLGSAIMALIFTTVTGLCQSEESMVSTDPKYGLTREKPVKVGSKRENGGPAAERAYLDSLRDKAGNPIEFYRVGNFGKGPYGNIIDGYKVTTSDGNEVMIYIDMYHPTHDPLEQPAPMGFLKAKSK